MADAAPRLDAGRQLAAGSVMAAGPARMAVLGRVTTPRRQRPELRSDHKMKLHHPPCTKRRTHTEAGPHLLEGWAPAAARNHDENVPEMTSYANMKEGPG